MIFYNCNFYLFQKKIQPVPLSNENPEEELNVMSTQTNQFNLNISHILRLEWRASKHKP